MDEEKLNEVKPKKIKCIEVEGEKVFMKKDSLGYRIVYPFRDESGKWIWWNILFGGKRQAINYLILLIILGIVFLGVKELIHNYNLVMANPCDYCVKPIINFPIN